MNAYKHTQQAKLILIISGAMALVFLVLGFTVAKPLFAGLLVMGLMTLIFGSMTIEMTDGDLRWSFGPGVIQKRVSLSEIESVKPIQTRLIDGWGIHYTRHGWLYNVSGFGAVAIKMRTGKRFALGTDEPEILAARVQEALEIVSPR